MHIHRRTTAPPPARGRWERRGQALVILDPWGDGAPDVVDEILGETPRVAPAPIKVAHYHIRKIPDPAHGGVLAPASAPTVMTAADMRPGYVLPAHPKRQALQTALNNLLRSKYATAISPAVNLRVALVDMTGAKRNAPVFSGFWAWGPGTNMEAGSLTKILALYALYQLRFDLDTCAARLGITKGSVLQARMKTEWASQGLRSPPDLPALFAFVEAPGRTVTARLLKEHDIHHNWVARVLILALGFEYIGSVALQSGLYDEAQGGLWLNAAYDFPAITWTTSPFPTLERHNATALAAATFFVLLAQGRLVDDAASAEIGRILARRVCMDNGLIQGIQGTGGVQGAPENKCGILSPLYHEAFHLVRQVSSSKRIEYVAAVLSTEPPSIDFTVLGSDLDARVVAANP